MKGARMMILRSFIRHTALQLIVEGLMTYAAALKFDFSTGFAV